MAGGTQNSCLEKKPFVKEFFKYENMEQDRRQMFNFEDNVLLLALKMIILKNYPYL